MVRTNTVIEPGEDAAIIRIKGKNKALSMKTDCNARYVYLSPRIGAAIAVAESARNVVCTGAKPVAITNCLNFGNPYKPEVYWQFAEAIAGMGEACRILNTPVTGGNVSFYNESETFQVYPTPVIGMLGVIEDLNHITRSNFCKDGDLVYLVGETFNEIGGSEYLKCVHDKIVGIPPKIDLDLEKNTQDSVLLAIHKGIVKSAHDISDGGLAIAIAECCICDQKNPHGLAANVSSPLRADILCFSETQSRFIISVAPEQKNEIEYLFQKAFIPLQLIGEVGGTQFSLNNYFTIELDELSTIYYHSLPSLMSR
jgi:phosphoribosylformylglycinamidine synthase